MAQSTCDFKSFHRPHSQLALLMGPRGSTGKVRKIDRVDLTGHRPQSGGTGEPHQRQSRLAEPPVDDLRQGRAVREALQAAGDSAVSARPAPPGRAFRPPRWPEDRGQNHPADGQAGGQPGAHPPARHAPCVTPHFFRHLYSKGHLHQSLARYPRA
jgi:hypothetical protein